MGTSNSTPALRDKVASRPASPASRQRLCRAPVEASQREHQEERLGVHGLQEEGDREDGDEQHRAAGDARAEVERYELVKQDHGHEVEQQREHDAGDDEVVVEEQARVAQQQRVEGEEGRAHVGVGIASLGDLDVPDPVPRGPAVQEVAEEAVEGLGVARVAPRPRRVLHADDVRGRQADGEDVETRDGGREQRAPQQTQAAERSRYVPAPARLTGRLTRRTARHSAPAGSARAAGRCARRTASCRSGSRTSPRSRGPKQAACRSDPRPARRTSRWA